MRQRLFNVLAVAMCLYVLALIGRPNLLEQDFAKQALFALLGLSLVFLSRPFLRRWAGIALGVDLALCGLVALVFGYLVLHTERLGSALWFRDESIGQRPGFELPHEVALGVAGLLLVLEAARRSVGWVLAILSGLFILYALGGHWVLDQRPIEVSGLVSKTFLQNGGVIGVALGVMFKYVFLFVVFGALLETTGATEFIIRLARRLFHGSVGGPAKVSVVSSGLMGSLSGSAVANTATTGTFTIPLMKGTGFDAETAGGVEAAASSGGALMPPIMGAGAYMMLELIDGVQYIEILQAALLPALLYYFALLVMVHWQAKKVGAGRDEAEQTDLKLEPMCGLLFFGGFGMLIFLLLPPHWEFKRFSIPPGFTADKAAAVSILGLVAMSWLHPRTRLGPRRLFEACVSACRSGVILVAAGGLRRDHPRGDRADRARQRAAEQDRRSEPGLVVAGTGAVDVRDHPAGDGAALGGVLFADGADRGRDDPGLRDGRAVDASLHFLLQHDVDDHSAGGAGGLRGGGDLGRRHHADGGAGLRFRAGGFRAALRLCAEAGVADADRRGRSGGRAAGGAACAGGGGGDPAAGGGHRGPRQGAGRLAAAGLVVDLRAGVLPDPHRGLAALVASRGLGAGSARHGMAGGCGPSVTRWQGARRGGSGGVKGLEIGGTTQVFAVLGHPVAHTLSPPMHNASLRSLGMDAVYLAFDVEPEHLLETLRAMGRMGFGGVNLTIPHKEVAFAGLERLDESARLVGGVNTVAFDGDGTVGHSTDGYGFLKDIEERFGLRLAGASVHVQGLGGAGRAIALVAAREGAARISLASRGEERRLRVEREIRGLGLGTEVVQEGDPREADLVVNGTPVGMRADDPPLLERGAFREGQFVYDMIYVRPMTPFLRPAAAAGARVANGLGMLLHQGARSFEIWTGRTPDVAAMRRALEARVYGG